MMRTIMRILAAACAAVLMGAAALSDDDAHQQLVRSLLFPSNVDVAQGKALAEDACSSCHSLNGISNDPALPHLAGQHGIYLYEELNAYRQGGRENRPMSKVVEFLSDDALRKVSVYYASLAPPNGYARPDASDGSQPGEDLAASDPVQLGKAAAAACAGCHGSNGNSQLPGTPSLTAQPPEYFATVMSAYQSGGRPGNIMNALVASIDEESIGNLALYYALQEPSRTPVGGTGDVASGREAAQACSSCHGADGNTTATDVPTLAGQDALYLATSLKAYAQGQRDHAQMSTATTELSDADIEALAAFYAQQEPIAREVHKPLTVAEWIERCDRCHGIGGNSSIPSYPSLAGQNEPYLAKVLHTYASGGRQNSTMTAMSKPLRPADIDALALHYSTQPRKSIVYVELPCKLATEQ